MKTSSMYILRGMCILSLCSGPKFFKCFEGMVLGVNLSKWYSVAAFSCVAFCVGIGDASRPTQLAVAAESCVVFY